MIIMSIFIQMSRNFNNNEILCCNNERDNLVQSGITSHNDEIICRNYENLNLITL